MTDQSLNEHDAVRFPEWGQVVDKLMIGEDAKQSVRQGVYAYLRWCKQNRSFACIATAKIYISEIEASGRNAGRPALRWFFKAAKEAALKGGQSKGAGLKPEGGGAPLPERSRAGVIK